MELFVLLQFLNPCAQDTEAAPVLCVACLRSESWRMWGLFLGWEGCTSLGTEMWIFESLTAKGRPHCLPGECVMSHIERAHQLPFCLLRTAFLHVRKLQSSLIKGFVRKRDSLWSHVCFRAHC